MYHIVNVYLTNINNFFNKTKKGIKINLPPFSKQDNNDNRTIQI